MSERQTEQMRELLEQINARLRDAEQLRNHAARREAPFWPERRRVGRGPDRDDSPRRPPDSSDR